MMNRKSLILERLMEFIAVNPKENSEMLVSCLKIQLQSDIEKYLQESRSWSQDTDHLQTIKHLMLLEMVRETLDALTHLTKGSNVQMHLNGTLLMSMIYGVRHLIELAKSLDELPERITTFIIDDDASNPNITQILQQLNDTEAGEMIIDDQHLQLKLVYDLLDEQLQAFLVDTVGEKLAKVISELQNVQELLKCNVKEFTSSPSVTNDSRQRLQVSEVDQKLVTRK